MIIGNYGGHLAYAMDPPFCMAYALDFINMDDPATMTFRNQENHPVSFTGDGLIICQLLVHWTAQSVSTKGPPVMDAFLFLEACSSLKNYFKR